MNSNKSIACPLDCFDTCEAVYDNSLYRGSKEHQVTNGKLCINFANLQKESFLNYSIFEDNKISMQESLDILVDKLKNTNPDKTLFYKGSGNLGVMQSATKEFFVKHGAITTKGSLCDGAGSKGLELGRGKVVNPPIENLINSDVIICWGRNFSITSPHMYNLVKDKTFITIDPIRTDTAKISELFMQINPKTDHELALLLTRFAYMEDMEDEEFIDEHEGADWFFDLAKGRPVVSYEKTTGISLSDVTKFFEIIRNKKVALMIGIGVQKYFEGSSIIRAIDSFAAYIGLHNKKVGGVWYLSDSAYGYEKQFNTNNKKVVSLPTVDFSDYDLVFIQGANPVVSSPNTKKIIEGLKNSFVVYFGTTLNETSLYANLVIPSSNFLSKRDVRLSYGHNLKSISQIVEKKDENSISEYELAILLTKSFGYKNLKDEDEILDYYTNHNPLIDHIVESFEFVEDLEIENLYEQKNVDEFYFITAKRKESLNSQFKSDNSVYLNSSSGFSDNDKVLIRSENGEYEFEVSISNDVKDGCALFFAGNKNANYLTPFKSDEEADSAIYQEVLVTIELS